MIQKKHQPESLNHKPDILLQHQKLMFSTIPMKTIVSITLLTIFIAGTFLVSFSNILVNNLVVRATGEKNIDSASSSILVSKKEHHPQHTFQSFNTTNPHVESWCPNNNVNCNNSPMCAPCNRRYLFIVATGRSGSTSLLKMFNMLPNIRLSGELGKSLLHNIRNVLQILNDSKTMKESGDMDVTEGAWMHNAIPKQSMSCTVQDFFYKINPPPRAVQEAVNETIRNEDGSWRPGISIQEYDKHTILGYKAIRIQGQGWEPDTAARFFKTHFPCSKFVINTRRKVKKQWKSMNKTFKRNDKTLDNIREENAFLEKFGKFLGEDRVRHIRMEDWVEDIDVLNDVVEWLGFRNCSFQHVVHENHDGYGRDHETDTGIDEQCHYPFSNS